MLFLKPFQTWVILICEYCCIVYSMTVNLNFSTIFSFHLCLKIVKQMTASLLTSCKCTRHPRFIIPSPINIIALCLKNVMHIFRNPGLLLFQFLIPTFQIVLFILAIGRNLKGLKVAYTNDDTVKPAGLNLSLICKNTDIDRGLLDYTNLGDLYISKLQEDDTFDLVNNSPHVQL